MNTVRYIIFFLLFLLPSFLLDGNTFTQDFTSRTFTYMCMCFYFEYLPREKLSPTLLFELCVSANEKYVKIHVSIFIFM